MRSRHAGRRTGRRSMAEGGPSPADPLFREDRPPVTGDGIRLLANYRFTSGRGNLARCIIGQDKLCHEVGCEDVSTVGLAMPCCPTQPLQEGAATSRPPGLSGAVKPADICRSARCAAPDINQTLSRQRRIVVTFDNRKARSRAAQTAPWRTLSRSTASTTRVGNMASIRCSVSGSGSQLRGAITGTGSCTKSHATLSLSSLDGVHTTDMALDSFTAAPGATLATRTWISCHP